MLSLFDGAPVRGIFTAQDTSQLNVQGLWESNNRIYVNITFTPCAHASGKDCADYAELEEFLNYHYLTVFTWESFIDFESVQEKEDTLKQQTKLALWNKITNTRDGVTYLMRLKEHQAELYDSRINFLGFSEPKEINYFNLEDQVIEYE